MNSFLLQTKKFKFRSGTFGSDQQILTRFAICIFLTLLLTVGTWNNGKIVVNKSPRRRAQFKPTTNSFLPAKARLLSLTSEFTERDENGTESERECNQDLCSVHHVPRTCRQRACNSSLSFSGILYMNK